MSQYSDSESQDSEDGIRYKTDTTRFKNLSSSDRSPKCKIGADLPPHLIKPEEEKRDSNIGPQLPNHLLKKQGYSSSPKPQPDNEQVSIYIGPQLPPHLLKKSEDSSTEQPEHEEQKDSFPRIGPQLPPHLQRGLDSSETNNSSYFGPQLPPYLQKDPVGPELPPQDEEESDDEVYGPLPAGTSTTSRAQLALEERALQLKMDQLDPSQNKAPVREEWMLELPTVKANNFGLGARQFRSKAGPDLSDRSSWTDTPEDKKKPKSEKVVDLKKEAEFKEIKTRDEEQEKISRKLKRKKESLLDIHQSKMKEKKKDEGPAERRPFSRELDLQVNRFDEAQKKAVLKKAQLLDDRFSRGQSKFL